MPLDPQAKMVLDATAALNLPPTEQMTPAQAREVMRARSAGLGPSEPVAKVEDHRVPVAGGEIAVRTYTPSGAGPFPALVFFHGGGWVIGDIDTHDSTVRALAAASGVTCVSVHYRRAPEDPFPAAIDDCVAAVRWVVDSAADLDVDPSRLAVGGDSAGGNLAAVAAVQLRDTPVDVRFQLLVYPVTDGSMSRPSYAENADGYFLTRETMAWFWDQYACDADRSDPRMSPLDATDEALRGVAPALVITAEYDPLRDEGEVYAARLASLGVDATASRYDRMIHGFLSMSDMVPEGKTAIDEAGQALRRALG
jgi:acetyl esterase